MTDADLARWEAALLDYTAGSQVPALTATDILALIAEVRRLRAEHAIDGGPVDAGIDPAHHVRGRDDD